MGDSPCAATILKGVGYVSIINIAVKLTQVDIPLARLIVRTGGEYRGVRHDRHFSAASSFQIGLTSPARKREVSAGGDMADKSQYSIVTYERRPGNWRAAITPIRRSGTVIHSKTITSIVTPDDFESEPDAQFAAEKIIRKL
jgi:hypothetical protein